MGAREGGLNDLYDCKDSNKVICLLLLVILALPAKGVVRMDRHRWRCLCALL